MRMHISFDEIRRLDAVAVRHSVELVRSASPHDWSRQTPCSEWLLRDLVAHMTAQHHGFAAAARGQGGDVSRWEVYPIVDDAASQYAEAADDVLAAFAAVEGADAEFVLPEFTTGRAFPAHLAIGFHLIDYLVHSWDVAVTLGLPFDPDADLVRVGLPIALAVPSGANRLEPGSPFQPVLSAHDDASAMDRILAVLGRAPVVSTR
jgi:uncharacterized protein (TIGR03086 family)